MEPRNPVTPEEAKAAYEAGTLWYWDGRLWIVAGDPQADRAVIAAHPDAIWISAST